MTIFSSRHFPILFRKRLNTTGLAAAIEDIDFDELCAEYKALRQAAPIRSDRDKSHFVDHDGRLDAQNPANPSEDHLAIALWRPVVGPGPTSVGRLRLLDYDGGPRKGRHPVLHADFASQAVLVPSDPARARGVANALPKAMRHRWFRSLRSSQALTQSVFGALGAFGRLDLLEGVLAECGRPAFLTDTEGTSLALEYKVNTLGERHPRSTSVDVLLEGASRRVAVECKFMEDEISRCSRPELRPHESTYAERHCDGNYKVQRGRRERCTLTEIGVRYWTYLPDLFHWDADRDLSPCPFSPVYQLARNALAATVTETGFDAIAGHVLVVYDARNPEFHTGGTAQQQYESAIAACKVPGLIRRLTWQRLTGTLALKPELAYLVAALEEKYGITAG